jgi:hypothetical protein
MVPVLGSAQGMSTCTAPALSSRGKTRVFWFNVPRGYSKEFQLGSRSPQFGHSLITVEETIVAPRQQLFSPDQLEFKSARIRSNAMLRSRIIRLRPDGGLR